MHILYIHQYFVTPLGTSGTRSYEFAKRWVSQNHKVTMLTSTAQLSCEDLAQAKGGIFKRFQVDGIDVIALNVAYKQQMGVIHRCWAFFVFFLLASITVLFLRDIDIIYATSTPLTIGIPALTAKWFKRKKYIFEVRDQWPESIAEIGVIKNRFILSILYRLEKIIYRNSSAIVAVSEGMAKDIQLVAGEKPVYSVPNGCDLDVFNPDIDGTSFREKHDLTDKLVLIHAGSIGRINDLDFVIRAAERSKEHSDIIFILIGKGNQKLILQDKIIKLGLTNVLILPSMPKLKLAKALAASDIIMAIIGKFPIIERHASLNKFYDGLSCGKPLLLNYSGWQGDILEENQAGFGCSLCDIDEFVEKVLYLNSNQNKMVEMGKNAHQIAIEQFNRDNLALQALEIIESAKSQT